MIKRHLVCRHDLPSPESLKRKILVKAKKLPADKTSDDDLEIEEDENEDLDEKRKTKPKVCGIVAILSSFKHIIFLQLKI